MADQQEKILVVESDPIVSDLIARQALGGQGFKVKVVEDASTAIQQVASFAPDLVIANLELPGLSGKDMMAALSSQGAQAPVIMIADQGKERDVIQAFRLGASDYISAPVRETEVVAAVERALKTVRARQEREALRRQIERTNEELQKRVNELTTIFSIGKAVTSITDQKKLFDKIIEGATKITTADYGWLLQLDERSNQYILAAHLNLPKSLAGKLGKQWDDGMSSLVAMSGESLSIHGEAIRQFTIGSLGRSALAVPVKVGKNTIALLSVVRRKDVEFSQSDIAMLEAVSDYASISMANVRLFRALDERAASLQDAVESAQDSEKLKDDIIQNVSHELRTPLVIAKGHIDMLVDGEYGEISEKQQEGLQTAQGRLARMVEIIEAMTMMHELAAPKKLKNVNLSDLANQAVGRWDEDAKKQEIWVSLDVPSEPMMVVADSYQLSQVFDAILSNAIKFSPNGGDVNITLENDEDNFAHVSISDQGIGISKKNLKKVFERFYQVDGSTTRSFDGLGIGLSLVQDIITAHGGEVWAESKLEMGSTFHFKLPGLD
jgi:signal transduction histidine kinase/FixJ family two-component response regulator